MHRLIKWKEVVKISKVCVNLWSDIYRLTSGHDLLVTEHEYTISGK